MATSQAHPSQKFRLEKSSSGDITYMTLHGVIDEGFEGQKLAEAIKTKKVVLNLRDVRRFASWGMAEWMNFMRASDQLDLYLVESATYAVNQMTLVTGLSGHAKLVSFYSPYRCARCGEEFETLVLIPNERAAIRELPNSEQPCATCGGNARMDKYPATMYSTIADRPTFDLDDEVVGYLRSRFKYDLSPDLARFRAFRRAMKGYTYLRLSGNLTTLQPEPCARASEGVTVVDLANVVFDPMELGQWHAYVKSAMDTASSVQLLDCPPGFLESAITQDDLAHKLKIRTFALVYQCPNCVTTSFAMIDVAPNLEQLIEGTVPTAHCPTCQSQLQARTPDAILRSLPAREHDANLEKFIAKARLEPTDKLEDALALKAAAKADAAPVAPFGRMVYVISGITMLAVIVIAVTLWRRGGTEVAQNPNPNPNPVVNPPPPEKFPRPDWIMSDIPSSGFCQDLINRVVCVGVSSYRANRGDAVAEASDAALEELVSVIGLKITNPYFKDGVLSSYSDVRAKALNALQADLDRNSKTHAAADDVVRKARHRVVEILQASGGAAVPAQRSDWHWEEYAVEKGPGTEFLVFVRYDVTLDAVKALVEKYSSTTPVLGSIAMTAFPSLAWQYADYTGGAVLTKVARPLAGVVAPNGIVMAVGDQKVADASSLAKRLDEWSKASNDLDLTVKTADAPAQVVKLKH
jgi:DNA-directed RNA polymerase subunit RPC12/RpoP